MNDNNINNGFGMPTSEQPMMGQTPSPVMEINPQPVMNSTPEPVIDINSQPVMGPTPMPTMDMNPQPVVEPAPMPTMDVNPQPVMGPAPMPTMDINPQPVVEPAPMPAMDINPQPVVEPAPMPVVEPMPQPAMPEQPQFAPTPTEPPVQNAFNQPMNNPYPNPTPEFNQVQPTNGGTGNILKDKKVLIIGGIALLLIVGIILYFTVFKKSDKKYNDIDDYYKEQEKIEERINKNFELKDYKILDGILIELKNNNSETINADIKVEFFDEAGTPVDVQSSYIFYLVGNGTGYTKVSTYGVKNYSTYKVTAKLDHASYAKTYNDKIKIVSSNETDDDYVFQIKNEADTKLKSVEIGILFIGSNNTILDFDTVYFDDLAVEESTTGKTGLPYDFNNHKKLKYEKIEIKVLNAVVLSN